MKPFKTNLSLILLLCISSLMLRCGGDDEPGNRMDIMEMDPDSPASLTFNDFVVITYEYNILAEDGARMWIIPYTDGDRTPGFLYSSSKVYNGTGTRQVGVSVEDGDGPVVVDQLKVTMVNPDQSETYIERFVNVNYTFSE